MAQPNLLFIHSDQHSPSVLGCYGDPLARTPNLDRLASQGVTFENAYCPSPLCVPSRASMLTGRHPHENRVWTNSHILDSAIPTYAHAMGAAGYRPVVIGRMHVLGPDQLHGYAERLIGDHSSNYPGGSPVDHGMLNGTQGPHRISLELSGPGQNAYQVHDEYVTAAALDYINRLGVMRRAGQPAEPFSLTVGFMLPHQPFVARREDFDLFRDIVGLPAAHEPFTDALHPHFRWWRHRCGIEEVTEEEVLRARAAYWALVMRMDAMIGQILGALEANGLAENTLIVYSSDHGEQAGEHGLWWKQTFYESSAKVPTILSWPGVLPAGRRIDNVISSLDVNATMLEALGAPPLPDSRGRSLMGLMRDASAAWEDIAFSEYCNDGRLTRMVRHGPWKLNYYHGHEPQLFHLGEDPHEMRDLAQEPDCQAVRAELMALVLDGWDPQRIALEMSAREADLEVLTAWAEQTDPVERFRWDLRPEMDFLD